MYRETLGMMMTTTKMIVMMITMITRMTAISLLPLSGEDKAVLVWRVFPYAEECLSLHLNLFCGQPPLYLALLGPLLALAFQELNSATYSMVHFNLLNQSRTDHPPSEDHVDSITGERQKPFHICYILFFMFPQIT